MIIGDGWIYENGWNHIELVQEPEFFRGEMLQKELILRGFLPHIIVFLVVWTIGNFFWFLIDHTKL